MSTVTAKLVSTQGPWLEAVLDIDGQLIHVIDEFSVDGEHCPKIGEEFQFEFSNMLYDEPWESMFNGNPEKRIGIEHISVWRYRCYGKIVQINPVVVDCGLFRQEGVIHTTDPRVVGEYIAFTVERMGGYAI